MNEELFPNFTVIKQFTWSIILGMRNWRSAEGLLFGTVWLETKDTAPRWLTNMASKLVLHVHQDLSLMFIG